MIVYLGPVQQRIARKQVAKSPPTKPWWQILQGKQKGKIFIIEQTEIFQQNVLYTRKL